ncbi:hypothetical protein K466DRAFT_142750 [Polyporus arcularius HHB13444]|uniref:Uncharacterized protein n=1 Tax=Polyporus arcularius HHB13444 TaxID=1314778 RepID=A0A5C3PAI1_9APHY|nr:hypothetical protein K466DRAFT_142750 [Polyporus arcularius HHB13444]
MRYRRIWAAASWRSGAAGTLCPPWLDPHPASGQRRDLYPTCNRGSTLARHHLRVRALSAARSMSLSRLRGPQCKVGYDAAHILRYAVAVTWNQARSRSQGRMRLWTRRASTRLSILSQGRWTHSALRV